MAPGSCERIAYAGAGVPPEEGSGRIFGRVRGLADRLFRARNIVAQLLRRQAAARFTMASLYGTGMVWGSPPGLLQMDTLWEL
jgi:hypothetical protein